MLYSETKAIKFGKTSGPLGVSIKMVVLTLMRKLPDLQMSWNDSALKCITKKMMMP